MLSGAIPPILSALTSLTYLVFDKNAFTFGLPPAFSSLTLLQTLSFSNNLLNGTIPSSYGTLSQLKYLYFVGNLLTGSIPAQLGSLINLLGLTFSGNSMTGAIPSQLGMLTNLTYLVFDNNLFTGGLPSTFGSLTKLQTLSFSGNLLTGTIPSSYAALTQLNALFFTGNQLTGTIPTAFGTFASLSTFYLDTNLFYGPSPAITGSTYTNVIYRSFSNNMWMSLLTWITTAPSTLQAGIAIQTSIQFSNNLTYNILSLPITLTLYNDPSCSIPSSISPTTPQNLTNTAGLAILTLNVTTAGTYYLQAVSDFTNSSCTLLTISAASPSTFVYTSQPTGAAVAGAAFTLQPMVLVQDFYGNPTPNILVTLTPYLDSGCTSPAPGSLTNKTLSTNTTGMVGFVGVAYPYAKSIYVGASLGGGVVCSGRVDVSVSTPYYLNSTGSGGGIVVAGGVGNQPGFLLTDYYGNAEAGLVVSVYLYLDNYCTSSAGSAGLVGNSSTTNLTGYTSFTVLQATTVGSYYFQARSGSVNSSCSTNVLTVLAGLPASIVYTTQPGGSVNAGSVFTVQPSVNIKDVYGNLIPASSIVMTAFTDSACLTLGRGSLLNSIKNTAISGTAAFVGLSYNFAGSIYIKAVAGD